MFESFEGKGAREGSGRRGVSALVSVGVFIGLAVIVGGAVTAHQVRKRRAEQEQQVEFAHLPTARSPRPKLVARPAAAKRNQAARQRAAELKNIPSVRPDEAEGELATADDLGIVDGLVEEKSKGGEPAFAPSSPPAPPPPKPEPVVPASEQERETILAPRFVSGCRAPEVPVALLSNAATIRIDVEMHIDLSGRVTSARVLSPHPLVSDELILQCAMAQIFEPAHLPDGTAVPYPFRRRFVFRPAQA